MPQAVSSSSPGLGARQQVSAWSSRPQAEKSWMSTLEHWARRAGAGHCGRWWTLAAQGQVELLPTPPGAWGGPSPALSPEGHSASPWTTMREGRKTGREAAWSAHPGAQLQGRDQEPPVRWERRLAVSAAWVTCLSSSNRLGPWLSCATRGCGL